MCMPIINPMYLYLIEVLHNIDVLNQGLFLLLSIAMFILAGLYIGVYEMPEEEIASLKWWTKAIGAIWLVSLSICIFVPTKDMMYKMLLAHYVTTDNIQIVNEAIKTNLQDYLNMLGETVKNMR
nr:MAG TPA: hypothetical protein [Caudoviricetes sp.]